jgi:EAL domain-containing protein (putative c-di-GMP-specific phosphodiesterase class I)/GGDEF domain-containing protein
MLGWRRRVREALARWRHGWALLTATVIAVTVGWTACDGFVWLPLFLAGGSLLLLQRDIVAHAHFERRLTALAGQQSASIDDAIAIIESRFLALDHRLRVSHPVSSLPMREHLFEVIERDIGGHEHTSCLGLFRIANFDRIAALSQVRADQILRELTDRLLKAAHRDRLLAQIDRDCLAIWLQGSPDMPDPLAELRALAFVADQEIDADELHLHPQLEIGVALHPADGDTPAQLLARANATLSRANGGDDAVSASIAIGGHLEDLTLEHDLAFAIEAGQLSMMYQPVVDLADGCLIGAEALLRWDHPERGAISPSRFIPMVETIGLSDVFGLWVLNTAARQAKTWQHEGLGALTMAVNLSAHQLLDGALGTKIMRTIERHRLAPGTIELELTESVAMADARHTRQVFADLRERGVRLAIDDFGTGYSSLSYLKQLPFDKLKIDRSFVTDIQKRRDSRAICSALVELGAGLDLTILAEGVECEEEVSTLLDLGCYIFQGYYFGRPMTGDDFLVLARDPDWQARLAAYRRTDPLERRACA